MQTTTNGRSTATEDYEDLVARYYSELYRFAFTLTRSEADAWDLTQQTFYLWSTKGGQLRDPSKVKAWMFTTLHRAFLQTRRRNRRFPHHELSEVESQLPEILAEQARRSDWAQVLNALAQVDERYQAPVALFYLGDHPYHEIAQILEVPLGTVKSRIARGIAQLQQYLKNGVPESQNENVRAKGLSSERSGFPFTIPLQGLSPEPA